MLYRLLLLITRANKKDFSRIFLCKGKKFEISIKRFRYPKEYIEELVSRLPEDDTLRKECERELGNESKKNVLLGPKEIDVDEFIHQIQEHQSEVFSENSC